MNHNSYLFFRIIPFLRELFYKYWNRIYFTCLGIKFGDDMLVNNKIYIIGKGNIVIGDKFRFTSGDSINPICRNVRGAIYLDSENAKIRIGNNVGMSSTCLWANDCIDIGDNVNIGGDCLIMDNDAHSHNYMERRKGYPPLNGKYKIVPVSPVVIEDDVWIGARCTILKGVRIGTRSIIAAGSVITKDIPSDCLAGGNPCKIIKNLK